MKLLLDENIPAPPRPSSARSGGPWKLFLHLGLAPTFSARQQTIGPVKLWTVQAPEVAAQLARGSNYSACWPRVLPRWVGAYQVMTAEMAARGIDCQGAAPVWAWPDWASPKQALYTADFLLGLPQWVHGVVMLRLAVPDEQILCTSYHAWNDFLNPESQPATMDFRGVLLSKSDCLQATIPQIKARWVRRARPMPMPRDVRRQILRDPYLRHLLIPPRSTAH